ncbi:YoaK family protein, partial [Aspergillus homomorphus CBS 101889]
KQWPTYLREQIREDLALEAQLLLLSFAIGIQDAAAWRDYGCFASNQTGNMLFLAIGGAGLATTADYRFDNLGLSLGSFVAGGLLMGQLGNYLGAVRMRWWLLFSSLLQTAMVFAAAAITAYDTPTTEQRTPTALATLFLLAFSSGAQVAMGRALKVTDITTAMATAAYIDVVIDPKLFKVRNRMRNRRVLFLTMLTAGCFAGAAVEKVAGSCITLIMCGCCKVVVMVGFFFTPKIKEQ